MGPSCLTLKLHWSCLTVHVLTVLWGSTEGGSWGTSNRQWLRIWSERMSDEGKRWEEWGIPQFVSFSRTPPFIFDGCLGNKDSSVLGCIHTCLVQLKQTLIAGCLPVQFTWTSENAAKPNLVVYLVKRAKTASEQGSRSTSKQPLVRFKRNVNANTKWNKQTKKLVECYKSHP